MEQHKKKATEGDQKDSIGWRWVAKQSRTCVQLKLENTEVKQDQQSHVCTYLKDFFIKYSSSKDDNSLCINDRAGASEQFLCGLLFTVQNEGDGLFVHTDGHSMPPEKGGEVNSHTYWVTGWPLTQLMHPFYNGPPFQIQMHSIVKESSLTRSSAEDTFKDLVMLKKTAANQYYKQTFCSYVCIQWGFFGFFFFRNNDQTYFPSARLTPLNRG